MQDELYLSGWEIEEISKTLTKHGDEVNTLVEKAASERAARYAYDHPKLPKGFVTIEQLQGDLDLGDLRDEVEDFDFDGDLTEAFGETAEYKVDDNQFSLDGGIPAWTVEGDDLAKVNDFLKKSCMEFCGSLPGDDRGEDGYSLSGEARDAATSRNGLNENRKSVAEMIQECFDSIENNGDAI